MNLATLAPCIEALGGELRLYAVFRGRDSFEVILRVTTREKQAETESASLPDCTT